MERRHSQRVDRFIGDQVSEDQAAGGAIYNLGSANISGTLFRQNSAPADGGAILNVMYDGTVPATLAVSGSTTCARRPCSRSRSA